MNRIYSKVWNASRGEIVVASELAKSPAVRVRTADRSSTQSACAGLPAAILATLLLASAGAGAQNFASGPGANAGPENPGCATAGGWINQANPGITRFTADLTTCGTAIGANADASQGNSAGLTAIGAGATAVNVGSVFGATALGTAAYAYNAGVAVGASAEARGNRSIAIGRQSAASADAAIGIGSGSYAQGSHSVAVGSGTHTEGDRAIAIGGRSTTWNPNAQTHASGDDAIAIGGGTSVGARAIGARTIALGASASASAQSATAIGDTAAATGARALAIGTGASAGQAGAVALGAGATTQAAVATTGIVLAGNTYGFAGTAPTSTVSVGGAGAERTVTHVAAGRVNASSTDAINGSQLHATNTALEQVSGAAHAGWNLSAQGQNASNVGPGGSVDLRNTDGNLVVAKTDDSNDVSFDLSDDIEIGNSITIGDTVINGDSIVTNNLNVSGETRLGDTFYVDNSGAHYDGPITDETHIVNKSYVDNSVRELGDTPLTFAGDAGTNVQRKLGETVQLVGGATDTNALTDGNIGVVANGTDTLALKLNKDIDLGEDGSVTIGNAGLTDTGLTVADAAGNTTTVTAGTVSVTDGAGSTSIGGSLVSVGGANPVVINGNAGTISGLTNQTTDAPDFANGAGRAATEEQLKQVGDVANAGWNISAQGENTSNVGPGGSVDLRNTDGNLVVAKTDDSNDVSFDLADDVQIANSLTVGGTTSIDASGVAVGTDVKLGGTGLVIAGGPSVTVDGIDAGGQKIVNVAAGTAPTDAVNVSQLTDTIDANRTRYYSVNSTGGGNVDNDGATGEDAIAAGKDAEAEGVDAIAIGHGAVASDESAMAFGAGAQALSLNGLAIGAGATVSHQNSIALGAGSATTVGAQSGYNGAYVGSSDSSGELNVGGRQITGVAAGSAATDAVNVSQLQGGVNHAINVSNEYTDVQIGDVNNRIDQIDGRVTTIEGDIVDIRGDITNIQGDVSNLDGRVTVVEGDVANLSQTINAFDNRVTGIAQGADGMFQVSQEGEIVKPTPTGANASAGGNGAVASGDHALAVGNQSKATGTNSTAIGTAATAAADNSTAIGQGAMARHENSVALGQGSTTTVGAQTDYQAAYVGRSSSTGEVNVGGRTLSGVAAGIAPTDAVNVSQLNAGVSHAISQANQYTDNRISQIENDVWTMDRGYRSATASAMAMAGLPQAYLPGKSMLAVGFGGYQNEYGMAVGLSGVTENGRYIYKAQASGNTARDWGFSVGAGVQW